MVQHCVIRRARLHEPLRSGHGIYHRHRHRSSGAAVKGAQVRVSSPDRGIDHTVPTNDSGDYLVAGLPPGPVDVAVAAQGFKKFEAKGVILRVGQKARTDIALQVGASNTVVEVEGTAVAQVETQSS